MKTSLLFTLIAVILTSACASPPESEGQDGAFDASSSMRMAAAANIVAAVNAKDATQYARDLHPDVIVTLYGGEVRLRGKAAVIENRRQHFAANPHAFNKLIHLAQIDNRVVMHDSVWLDGNTAEAGANIVEIFTFDGDRIVRIDVIQPAGLFGSRE